MQLTSSNNFVKEDFYQVLDTKPWSGKQAFDWIETHPISLKTLMDFDWIETHPNKGGYKLYVLLVLLNWNPS